MSSVPLDDWYWGGYTEHGELLHLAVARQHGHARSACGLTLADAWDIPDQMRGSRCSKCVAAERSAEQAELEALAGVGSPDDHEIDRTTADNHSDKDGAA